MPYSQNPLTPEEVTHFWFTAVQPFALPFDAPDAGAAFAGGVGNALLAGEFEVDFPSIKIFGMTISLPVTPKMVCPYLMMPHTENMTKSAMTPQSMKFLPLVMSFSTPFRAARMNFTIPKKNAAMAATAKRPTSDVRSPSVTVFTMVLSDLNPSVGSVAAYAVIGRRAKVRSEVVIFIQVM